LAKSTFRRMSLNFVSVYTHGIFRCFSELTLYPNLNSFKLSSHMNGYSGRNECGVMWKLLIVRVFTTSNLKKLVIPLTYYRGNDALIADISWLLDEYTDIIWYSTIVSDNISLFDLKSVTPTVSKVTSTKTWNGVVPHSYRICDGKHFLVIWSK
jgi:hypothetical protein